MADQHEYDWNELRSDLIDLYEEVPRSKDLEEKVIRGFERNPQLFEREARKIGKSYRDGIIRSPWVVLKLTAEKLLSPARQARVTDTRNREQALTRARAWVREMGKEIPTENELCFELFDIRPKTASLAFLEKFERQTRKSPSRPMWIGLLQAQMERTKREGVQEVPGNPSALLRDWATDAELVQEMVDLWHSIHDPWIDEHPEDTQPTGEELENSYRDPDVPSNESGFLSRLDYWGALEKNGDDPEVRA